MELRKKIVNDFAEWTAFCSTRSGCPVKSRDEIYPLLRIPDYKEILIGGPISETSFNKWHRESTENLHRENTKLPIGWAAKLINVYLKTRVYIAGEGRPNLVNYIHPPIDGILWKEIRRQYSNKPEIIEKTHIVTNIRAIKNYKTYETIIDGCHEIAKDRRYENLIEVDTLWDPKGG